MILYAIKVSFYETFYFAMYNHGKNKYNRIMTVLTEKGKTNKWLAQELGRDISTVSRWCTNDMQPSIDTLFQIANLLGVLPSILLSDIKLDKS